MAKRRVRFRAAGDIAVPESNRFPAILAISRKSRGTAPLTKRTESSSQVRLAPQEQHRYEQANGEFRQSGFLRDVNQDENFGDAVFSDGPLAWETQGKIAFEWLPKRNKRYLTAARHWQSD